MNRRRIPPTTQRGTLSGAAVLVMFWTCVAVAGAQDAARAQDLEQLTAEGPEWAFDGRLAAEVLVDETLVAPNRPLLVRFLLHNLSDDVVAIPVNADTCPMIELPRSVVLGAPDTPAVAVAFNDEPAATLPGYVSPDGLEADAGTDAVLQLGPHASIGATLDLTDWSKLVRYTGDFVVSWSPFGGRIGTAEVSFRIEPRYRAMVVTAYGKITFDLFYDAAPQNVANFLELARSGFYDDKTFHRVVPGFAIQGGSPDGTNRGGRPDGRTVPAEWHAAPFEPGTLAMARKPNDPDSASSQFFIALARVPALDGQYTVIGQARDETSLRTLQRLAAVPTNDNYQPLSALTISSVNLVPVDAETTRRLELKPLGTGRGTENLQRSR